MPSETSSQIAGATNGIEPPRGLIAIKQSKNGVVKQVVPEIKTLSHKYELLWQMPDNSGYLKLCGIIQKFVDQAISANINYDPRRFKEDKVPLQTMLTDLLTAYKYGLKTLYYHNTRDDSGEHDPTSTLGAEECESGACKL